MISSTQEREGVCFSRLKWIKEKVRMDFALIKWSTFICFNEPWKWTFFNIVSDGNQIQQQGRFNPQPGPFCCIFGAVIGGPICQSMADVVLKFHWSVGHRFRYYRSYESYEKNVKKRGGGGGRVPQMLRNFLGGGGQKSAIKRVP